MDIGKDLQRAYDDGYAKAIDEFAKALSSRLEELTHDNPMVTSNYILRKEAIEIADQLAEQLKEGAKNEKRYDIR